MTPIRGVGADVTVGVRTGDTPQRERAAMRRHPPDILITTPESLYLMLTSGAREILTDVEAVIVDEIHAVAATKRGSHLALTLERLAANQEDERDPQRIGLSATQNPLEEIGRFLVGPRRTCRVVDTGVRKPLDLKIHVPVESMVEPDQGALNGAPAGPREPRGRRSRHAPLDLAGDLPGDPAARRASTPRRSCSSTAAAAPSGWRCASTSWRTPTCPTTRPSSRSRAPTTARSRARSAR